MKKIDQAWDEKRYDEVLLLLQQDSLYPENFKYEDLKDCDSPLKNFIDGIVKLHEHVRNGDLSGVKEITSRYKSERYLNPDNQSAALTALQNRKFRVYAYLKSIGIILNDFEKYFIDKELEITDKKALQEILRSYFPMNDDSLISFLTLKSKSINPPENFRELMTEHYTRLNRKIPNILKVVGYENNLEVIFDNKDENTVGICGYNCYGVTFPEEKSIYLGSMREEDETLGTLAHELTHLAMEMVFKNECKPYETTDAESENQFEEITKRIASALSHFNGGEAKIIARAFKYEPEFHHSELTARVSQILTSFQNGEEWLQNHTPDLLAFYSEKVLPKCQEFISRSFLIKPRNTIKTLNEKFGEIGSLIKYGLFFENLEFLTNFLNSQTISFFITKNGRFGLLRVLQALLGKMYVNYYDNFIVFKFQDCVTFLTDIKIAFDSEATDFLLLDCASVRNSLLKDEIQEITFSLGANKKIIFVAEENQSDIIKELAKSNPSWGLMPDENFCLKDFDSESQQKILQIEILLQGRKTNLRNLLGQNKELHKLITSDVIGHLFSDGKVEIGNKIFGISELEGSYAQILQKIDTASLKREINNSDSVVVFMGDRDKVTELNLTDEIAPVDLKNSGVVSKKILWTESLEDDFKQFCQSNPLKKVYLINITGDEFLLQQIFNPDFYMKRKVRKIVMNLNNLEHSIKTNRKETFIFTGGGTLIESWKKKYSNVKTFDETKGSQNSEDVIHWIQEENGALIWKNSRGSIGKVLLASSEELSSNHLTEENELVKDIAERKIMIISDEPGMGKSTTVTKLYQTPVIDKKHWIIRINLKDCLKAIRNLPSTNLTIRDVITFLQGVERNLNNTLTTLFLDLLLDPQKKISKDLLLVFDGFDELLDEKDRNTTIRLLKFLRNATKSKVWIASRLQYKRFLEMELITFALRFDPLDNNMKREFIKKYYGDRLNLILSEEQLDEAFHGGQLETYVENFIRKMESIFQENLSTILGTPLQLNLLLDGSTEYFLSWLKNGSDVDFSYLGDNLFQVYENFIHRKYLIYFKKKKIEEDLIQESMKTSLEPYHKHLARNFLYKTSLEDIEKYKPLILLIGLVQLQNENLQFFHFTFREFYSAKIIVEFLTGDGIEETNFTEAARKYLVKQSTLIGNRKGKIKNNGTK